MRMVRAMRMLKGWMLRAIRMLKGWMLSVGVIYPRIFVRERKWNTRRRVIKRQNNCIVLRMRCIHIVL